MTVGELLQVVDLTNVKSLKINNQLKSLVVIKTKYKDCICDKLEIKCYLKPLTTGDIKVDIITSTYDVGSSEAIVDFQLPTDSIYLQLEINFILNEKEF